MLCPFATATPAVSAAPHATATAAARSRGARARRATRVGLWVSAFILPALTGLAGGLAPKDWRYAAPAAISPWTRRLGGAASQWFPRSPGTCPVDSAVGAAS